MMCAPDRNRRARRLANTLELIDCVAAVDVLPPDCGPQDEWILEVVVGRSHVPPQVLLAVGAHHLPVEPPVRRRGDHTVVVATLPG